MVTCFMAGLAEAAAHMSKQQKAMITPLTAKELGRAEPREPHVKPELTRVAEAAQVSPRLSCS